MMYRQIRGIKILLKLILPLEMKINFQKYRDYNNGDVCIPDISLNDNIFKNRDIEIWKRLF